MAETDIPGVVSDPLHYVLEARKRLADDAPPLGPNVDNETAYRDALRWFWEAVRDEARYQNTE